MIIQIIDYQTSYRCDFDPISGLPKVASEDGRHRYLNASAEPYDLH